MAGTWRGNSHDPREGLRHQHWRLGTCGRTATVNCPTCSDAADPEAVAYLSIEPHLSGTKAGRGRDRAALWREAHAALMRILDSR